jgi:hypothetical protein
MNISKYGNTMKSVPAKEYNRCEFCSVIYDLFMVPLIFFLQLVAVVKFTL